MAWTNNLTEKWSPRTLGVLRLVTAYLYLQHGTTKVLHFPYPAAYDVVDLWSLAWVAGVIEIVGAALLIVGLWVRPTAFLLCGEMAVGYFLVHAPMGHVLSPMQNQGEPAVLYCFIFLYLAIAGGGAWCLDRLRASSVQA